MELLLIFNINNGSAKTFDYRIERTKEKVPQTRPSPFLFDGESVSPEQEKTVFSSLFCANTARLCRHPISIRRGESKHRHLWYVIRRNELCVEVPIKVKCRYRGDTYMGGYDAPNENAIVVIYDLVPLRPNIYFELNDGPTLSQHQYRGTPQQRTLQWC